MPQQEVFFDQRAGDRQAMVLKTYDQSYAREVFEKVDDPALKALAQALGSNSSMNPTKYQQLTNKIMLIFSGKS